MKRLKIIADHKIPYLKGALEPLADITYLSGREITNSILKNTDALIIRTRTRCDEALLAGSGVKCIASATIGFDHIDTDYCEKNGIKWTNAPGCNSSSVEQYIVSVLLYLGKKREIELSNSTIGIIGVGNVGKKVAKAAGVLGMKVLKNDPPRERIEGKGEFTDLDHVLSEADIVTLHVPLYNTGPDKTLHLVDEKFLKRMKKGSVLINSSRGRVVNEVDLKKSLHLGRLSDVILDVFEKEPEVDLDLLPLLTIATPHIAGYSADGKANGTMMSVRAISRYFHLGIDDWKPDKVPSPDEPDKYIDASGERFEDLLRDLYFQTYDVTLDDRSLRNSLADFEKLREEYPLRREPSAYTVKIFNGDLEIVEKIEELGFSVIADACF